MPEIRCQVASYVVSAVPESEDAWGGDAWSIRVEYVGENRWAVRRGGRVCLSRAGKWGYESIPSERTDEWLADNRFSLDEALEVAKREAPNVVVNSMTPADVIEFARSHGRLGRATVKGETDA